MAYLPTFIYIARPRSEIYQHAIEHMDIPVGPGIVRIHSGSPWDLKTGGFHNPGFLRYWIMKESL